MLLPWGLDVPDLALAFHGRVCLALFHQLPLTRVQRLTEWPPRYQLVHLISDAICFCGSPEYSRAMHAAFLGNPNPNGPQGLQGLFSHVAPVCAIHTTCMDPS